MKLAQVYLEPRSSAVGLVYALDGTALEKHPYKVMVVCPAIVMVQPSDNRADLARYSLAPDLAKHIRVFCRPTIFTPDVTTGPLYSVSCDAGAASCVR